ncbi:DnaJ domain-containing protein [Piptocephalis cylindrospora]|uniref:DnaJ domain-containing protein n=1 Tax=Piptocephalis cylindrospora TaxID=1907219 RepID=A0A4P9Y5P7_9FUNG|nr:DnaJ domain-containing protein [Piptocephalis cylindrospora]|eukprot:RKP13521.1 DnaJ domain-containing protein [Piptocephalis cylindrospora]
MTTVDFLLPSPPASWTAGTGSKVHGTVSAPKDKLLEAVGPFYHAHARRSHYNRTLSEDDRLEEARQATGNGDEEEDVASEPEDDEMLRRDPKDWKNQDHYAVLGLSKLRYRAKPDQIIRAHRKKVLKHHPDKKAAGGNTNDDGFFKCIQKAFEICMDPTKRAQWDSVDPAVPDTAPPAKLKGDFFKAYRPVFRREARFSIKPNVPDLGDLESSREHVEAFYDFFYNFDSWRTFEYLDKEDVDGADNRDTKRWMDKKNKTERAKKKKDDNARLRELVDQALKSDPRIALFKEQDKTRRGAKKAAREAEEKAAAEAKAKAEAEAAAAAESAAAAAKSQAESAKKDKEAKKRAVRKEKKLIKALLKDNNYFVSGEADSATPEQVDSQLDKLERAFTKNADDLEGLRKSLEEGVASGKAADIFDTESA